MIFEHTNLDLLLFCNFNLETDFEAWLCRFVHLDQALMSGEEAWDSVSVPVHSKGVQWG